VLRGPQGTLFGRNTTGGVIQVVTRNPLAPPSLEATIGYGNYRTATGTFYGNAHIVPNLGISLSADFRHQGEGYGENTILQKDILWHNNVNVRGKIAFEPDPDTTITALVQYRRAKNTQTNYAPLSGTRGVDLVEGSTYGPFESRAGIVARYLVKDLTGYFRVEQGIGDFAKLTSITSYRKVDSNLLYDQDATTVFFVNAEQIQTFHNFSQEIQLSSRESGPLTWVVGGIYYNALAGSVPTVVTGAAAGASGRVAYYRKQRTKSLAGFGQLTYGLTENTNLTAGLRYTDETQTIPSGLYTLLGLDPATATRLPWPPTPLADVDSSGWTWRLALDHHFTPDIMGYVSWNHGLKGGGFSLIATAASPGFRPERLDAYEAGLRMEFLDGGIRINPSVFLYKFKDIQFSIISSGASSVANAAAATIEGADLDAVFRITDRFRLNVAFEYLHSNYDSFPNAVYSVPRPAPLGGGVSLPNQDASGNTMLLAPKFSGNVGYSYTAPVAGGELLFDGSIRYVGSQFSGVSNLFKIPAYTLVTAGLGWTSADERIGARIWADNLFNKKYVFSIFESGALGVFRNAGEPRTYGITLSTKW
jgi:iron complex outermembrane receptor protein